MLYHLFLLCCLLTSTLCPYCGPLLCLQVAINHRDMTRNISEPCYSTILKKRIARTHAKNPRNAPRTNGTTEEQWKRSRSSTRRTASGRLLSLWHEFSIALLWPAARSDKAEPDSPKLCCLLPGETSSSGRNQMLGQLFVAVYLKGGGEWWF